MSVKRSSGFDNLIRGADTLLHQGAMFTKAMLWAVAAGVIVMSLFVSIGGSMVTTTQERYFAMKHIAAKVKSVFFLGGSPVEIFVNGQKKTVNADSVVLVTNDVFERFVHKIAPLIFLGFLAGTTAGIFIVIYWTRRGAKQAEDEYIRGAKLLDGSQLEKLIIEDDKASKITIGGTPTIRGGEMLHTIISGAVGTGKSVSIIEILESVRKQGKRAIVYDPTGEFTEIFYREGKDVVLNPIDARSPNWNLWREIRSDFDYRTFATALVQVKSKTDPFFEQSARIVAEELFKRLAQTGDATNKAVYDAAGRLSIQDLHSLLKGTSAANLIDPAGERTALSVRSSLLNAMNAFRYLHDDGGAFSIRGWTEKSDDDSWLFIPSRKDQHEAIKPLITLWLEIAIRGVMNLPPIREPRFWLVVDELPSLQKIEALQTAVTETRKYGLCGVFGIQSVSQMREIYGKDGAQTIMGMCQTWVVLRVADPETAQYLSDTLGKADMQEKDESLSFGVDSTRDGTNLGSRRMERVIVMPSEIQHLPDLHGFMRVPGPYPVARIALQFKDRQKLAEPFVLRHGAVIEPAAPTGEVDSVDAQDPFA
jgi:type IV conjugative transfer system coupling protein TraD